VKCECLVRCYVEGPTGLNEIFKPGQVVEFDECPKLHFKALGDEVDFLASSGDVLLASKWRLEDAKKAIKEAYGVTITAKKKETIVAQILDARNRTVDTSQPTNAK